jgi:hypothetical protein
VRRRLANHWSGLALVVLAFVIALAVAPFIAQGQEAVVTRGKTRSRPRGERMPELEPAERDVGRLRRHMPTPRLNAFEAEALAAYLASLR